MNLLRATRSRRRDAVKMEGSTSVPRERVHHGTLHQHVPEKMATVDDYPATDGYVTRIYKPGRETESHIPGSYITEEPSLDVSWLRDTSGESTGWVQVSIDMPRKVWFERVKELESDVNQISQAVYTETLTRDELNKMIRVLRRARDQAFGADE